MKNRKLILGLVLYITAAVPLFAQQYNPEKDFKIKLVNNEKEVEITGYKSENTYVNIPPRIDNLPVTGIGDKAFTRTGIRIIIIPDSITSIGDKAFIDNDRLEKVTIGKGVKSIGARAFNDCRQLIAIDVHKSNKEYTSVDGVLYDKKKTVLIQYPSKKTETLFTVPKSVTSIEYGAFERCGRLKSVIIPNSVTSIGDSAFSYCTNLESVNIPVGVTSIGDKAFSHCTNLESVNIPVGVTSIGEWAFKDCRSLTSVIIPNSVTSIQMGSFEYCRSLTSVTISNSVTSIWWNAFYKTGLTSVIIPGSVIKIEMEAFQDCRSLTSVTFEGTITENNFGAVTEYYGTHSPFDGDLRDKYLAGGKGTYTTNEGRIMVVWTKQP
jgi:hypothetical protein